MGITNLKAIGQLPEEAKLSMACRKDLGPLQSILDKALETITDEEWNRINQKWFSVRIEHGIDYKLLWRTITIAAILLIITLLWNRSLSIQIHHRKVVEEKLQQETALKETLINMIIHDMRSPLQVLRSIVDLFADSQDENEKKEFLNFQDVNITHLMHMVSDVIDTKKMEEVGLNLHKIDFDIIPVIKEYLSKIHLLRKEVTYHIDQDNESILVHSDKAIIERVLQNLFSNSIKFTKSEIRVTVQEDEEKVTVKVHDNGPGIPLDHHATIFEKFGQVHEDGMTKSAYSTGLGLTFCKLAVETHDGEIGVENGIDGGATFWFTIPK